MKLFLHKKFTLLFYIFLLAILFSGFRSYGQSDSAKVSIPHPIQQNAGFDVIVKLNGDLVYGLVKEVGPYFISYQRTDIPDGPVYTISRNEVYVISYRNQVKDYINGREEEPQQIQTVQGLRKINYKKSFFKNPSVHLELGFLRSYSKVKDESNYSSTGSLPVVSLGYEISYSNNIQLGIMLGFGTHKFSDQRFSTYDSTNNNISLKENIFGLYVYGRYYFLNATSRLQPYILAGPGITSSNVHSENRISFTNDNSQIILVKSGTRSTGLGIIAKVGAQYFINNQFQLSFDAGVGLSVVNVGVSFSLK
ncbi:MAG: outer membrane beta-barrel protein [Ginsengibacter sp.]